MDYITEMQGQVVDHHLWFSLSYCPLIFYNCDHDPRQPNYLAAFIIADILIGISLFCALKVNLLSIKDSSNYTAGWIVIFDLWFETWIFQIDMDLELPKSKDSMGGLKAILTNLEILLFLVMMFVCGSMYGFVETFLFVFLKEDLHAPM